ncbi:MarR family transcriptional regulator [Catellatospora vulcania]|uniref:MarR family transcriptional regulator n=1 Tax=Catellatospora vulcania TaxID=1460450 RepID=UPI0012D40946|nr:MarR family transcriptional regulator [Catellatospora vulcania]
MSSVAPGDARARRQRTHEIKDGLRELRDQLAMLNRQVGARLELKDVDLDCLELISRHGPLNPGAVARRAGVHPATMTGILDRLEHAGWVTREPDPADRRGVSVRALPDRAGEVHGLLAGMNNAVEDICAGYSYAELDVIAGFLDRAIEAGRAATEDLAGA